MKRPNRPKLVKCTCCNHIKYNNLLSSASRSRFGLVGFRMMREYQQLYLYRNSTRLCSLNTNSLLSKVIEPSERFFFIVMMYQLKDTSSRWIQKNITMQKQPSSGSSWIMIKGAIVHQTVCLETWCCVSIQISCNAFS